jgi:hypothetical protein
MQQRACGFLEKNAHDLTLICAVLSGPAYLSASTTEFQFVCRQLEKHAPHSAELQTAGHHPPQSQPRRNQFVEPRPTGL